MLDIIWTTSAVIRCIGIYGTYSSDVFFPILFLDKDIYLILFYHVGLIGIL